MTVPAKVENLNAISKSASRIAVAWDDVDGGNAEKVFTICYEGDIQSTCENTTTATTTTWQKDDLLSNTGYKFRVRGVNNGGAGDVSESTAITCKLNFLFVYRFFICTILINSNYCRDESICS